MESLGNLVETEFTQSDIAKALKPPENFAYMGDNEEMFETWSLGPTFRTRDSGLAEESNADALEKALAEAEELGLIEKDSYEINRANHWAVGWVDHLSYQVIDDDGEPTPVARLVKGWFEYLREVYPLADEEDHSEREYEATIKNIEFEGKNVVSDDAPEGWAYEIYSWLSENNQGAVENNDDQGGYPSREEIREAAEALGFAEPEDE